MKKTLQVCAVLLAMLALLSTQARQIIIRNMGMGSISVKQIGQATLLGTPREIQAGQSITLNNATPNAFTLEFKDPDLKFIVKLKEGKSFRIDVPAGTTDQTIVVNNKGPE